MTIEHTLRKLGFSEKEVKVYLTLLQSGPLPVRALAVQAEVNRGTTYDILKSLRDQGLVSYYHQATRQYFVAENPERLTQLLEEKQVVLASAKSELAALIPELRSMHTDGGDKPVVKYYEGPLGIKAILQDVLDTMSAASTREYLVYSSSDIRGHLYQKFPNFSDERIKRKISVRIIALGEGGQELGLDERRWLTRQGGAPTYSIIYHDKTAFISVSATGNPLGIIIQDAGLAQTQTVMFEHIWQTLGK